MSDFVLDPIKNFGNIDAPLLSVKDLTVEFHTDDGVVQAVTDLSYDLHPGETLGIMGESGSGKSVSVQALMGLIPQPPGKIPNGSITYRGLASELDLISMPERQKRSIRGTEIAMIFQDPLTSLNPVFPVGWQIGETLRIHQGVSRRGALVRAVDLMQQVGIPNAKERARQFPHQFSGGMRQRAMIAMALALEPKILIADEPTTALDVTVQAQIMELLAEVQERTGMSLILITHDLGVVASVADRVLVMYAGRCVETASAKDFYARPEHPYSRGLLASVPRVLTDIERLVPVEGQPPSLITLPSGCAFHPRCPYRNNEECMTERPTLEARGERQRITACHRIGEF
jgi:oligopeptide transport system ATP-binding protein